MNAAAAAAENCLLLRAVASFDKQRARVLDPFYFSEMNAAAAAAENCLLLRAQPLWGHPTRRCRWPRRPFTLFKHDRCPE